MLVCVVPVKAFCIRTRGSPNGPVHYYYLYKNNVHNGIDLSIRLQQTTTSYYRDDRGELYIDIKNGKCEDTIETIYECFCKRDHVHDYGCYGDIRHGIQYRADDDSGDEAGFIAHYIHGKRSGQDEEKIIALYDMSQLAGQI